MVYFDKVLVFIHLLLEIVYDVYLASGVGSVGLAVEVSQMWQTVSLLRVFVRHAKRNGSHGECQSGQAEQINDALRIVERCAEITCAVTSLLCQCAESLHVEERVTGSIDKGEEVVISRISLTLLTPLSETIEVSTESQHHESFSFISSERVTTTL